MSDTKEKTCAEQIESRLKRRIAHLAALFTVIDNASEEHEYDYTCQESEDAEDELNNFFLCVDYQQDEEYGDRLRFTMSTGGPSDDFLVYVNHAGDIYKIEYQFQDWFDGATVHLRGSNKDTAIRAIESIGYYPETLIDFIQTQIKEGSVY